MSKNITTPKVVKELTSKLNKEHEKYLEENKDAIQEMQQKIKEQEISSQQMIKQKFITGEYKKTVKQVTKNCKL